MAARSGLPQAEPGRDDRKIMTHDCIPLLVMSCLAFITAVLMAGLIALGLLALAAGRDAVWERTWQLSAPPGFRSIAFYVARRLLQALLMALRGGAKIWRADVTRGRPARAASVQVLRRTILPPSPASRVTAPRHYQTVGGGSGPSASGRPRAGAQHSTLRTSATIALRSCRVSLHILHVKSELIIFRRLLPY